MQNVNEDGAGYHKIGQTYGLAQRKMDDTAPEQVLVHVGPDADRPVIMHGWVGYRVPMKMELTYRQTRDLIGLLTDALFEQTL